MGTFVCTSPITIAARLSVMFTAVVVPVRLFAQEKTGGAAAWSAQAGANVGLSGQNMGGSTSFFEDVDQGLGTFIEEAGKNEIQTTAGILDSILPHKPPVRPLRMTPDQRKAFEGAAGVLDEFLSGWRQSGSLTSEQQRAIEDAVKALNEMSSVPMSESVTREEQPSALMPEPTPARPIEVKTNGTTGKFGPFQYTLPEGWTANTEKTVAVPGIPSRTILRVKKGGQEFLFSPHPGFVSAGYKHTPHDTVLSLQAGFIRRPPGGATTVLTKDSGSSMGTTTVGKEKIPAVWGKEQDGKVVVVFQHEGQLYMSSYADGDTKRVRDEFLASLSLEKPEPQSSPSEPKPPSIPPQNNAQNISSDFLRERGKDFFSALAHIASENGAHNLAASSDMIKMFLKYPEFRDTTLDAWQKTLSALQGGSYEDMDQALLMSEYHIAGAIGGMVGMKAGALLGPTPQGTAVAVLSARGTSWAFERYIDGFHLLTEASGQAGEIVIPWYVGKIQESTEYWESKGLRYSEMLHSR